MTFKLSAPYNSAEWRVLYIYYNAWCWLLWTALKKVVLETEIFFNHMWNSICFYCSYLFCFEFEVGDTIECKHVYLQTIAPFCDLVSFLYDHVFCIFFVYLQTNFVGSFLQFSEQSSISFLSISISTTCLHMPLPNMALVSTCFSHVTFLWRILRNKKWEAKEKAV